MEKKDTDGWRWWQHRKSEAKKKSRSLPWSGRTGGPRTDLSAVWATYRKEEGKAADSSLGSDTSCSWPELWRAEDCGKVADDSSSSAEKRNHSLDSLTRKERMEALKARVEAQRSKYGDSSSEEEEEGARGLPRYHSDEAIHRSSREPCRWRSGRTERFLKRKSRDESWLRNFSRAKPTARSAGQEWWPTQVKSPGRPAEAAATDSVPPLISTTDLRQDRNPGQPSPNDSGLGTQSVASSPSAGRAPSPGGRRQEGGGEPGPKARFRNLSCGDRWRSCSEVGSDRCAHSPPPASPLPVIHSDCLPYRCRRPSTVQTDCCGRAAPKFPACRCRAEMICCSLPFRHPPHCSHRPADGAGKLGIYSYTDRAPGQAAVCPGRAELTMRKVQRDDREKTGTDRLRSESTPLERQRPCCPVHRPGWPPPSAPFDRTAGQKPRSPPSVNCRPLSMVIDTLDYLTDPKNYARFPPAVSAGIQGWPRPVPPIPPVRKYRWNSVGHLAVGRSGWEETGKKTESGPTSPESDCRASDGDRSADRPRTRTGDRNVENLDRALKELEEIYRSLQLNDEDLADRAERRDLPTRYQQRYSSTAQLSNGGEETPGRRPISGSYDCLLVCNRPVRTRAPPLRRAGVSDKVTDDLAYRRFQRAVCGDRRPGSERGQSYLLCSAVFTPSLRVDQYSVDLTTGCQPDVERDDLSYRNYARSTGTRAPEVQPLFGIPVGPVVESSPTSYLRANPREDTRPIYRHQETPDLVRDDMAYRNLRKDARSRSVHKRRAVRSLSANLFRPAVDICEERDDRARSTGDLSAAPEKQASPEKRPGRRPSPDPRRSPEESGPAFRHPPPAAGRGRERPQVGPGPDKERAERRVPVHSGPEKGGREAERAPSAPGTDCRRPVPVASQWRRHKSLSAYQPSVCSPPPPAGQDIWSDSDVRSRRRTLVLDESRLEALLTSLSAEAGRDPTLAGGPTCVDLRVTA